MSCNWHCCHGAACIQHTWPHTWLVPGKLISSIHVANLQLTAGPKRRPSSTVNKTCLVLWINKSVCRCVARKTCFPLACAGVWPGRLASPWRVQVCGQEDLLPLGVCRCVARKTCFPLELLTMASGCKMNIWWIPKYIPEKMDQEKLFRGSRQSLPVGVDRRMGH